MFMEGKNEKVIQALLHPMQKAAAAMQYEQAAKYRDQISALRKVQERQYITSQAGNIDVIACKQTQNLVCLKVFFIRWGRNLGSRSFFPKNRVERDTGEIMGAFLSQFYLNNKADIPDEILLSHQPDNIDILQNVLRQQINKKVSIKHKLRGDRAKWLKLAIENAEVELSQRLASSENQQQRMKQLCKFLALDETIEQIECFDISHTSGQASVASCVVFGSNGPQQKNYRKFNISNIKPGDDYAAMKQAISRRYIRVCKEQGRLPDLIIIDGGKGTHKHGKRNIGSIKTRQYPITWRCQGHDP